MISNLKKMLGNSLTAALGSDAFVVHREKASPGWVREVATTTEEMVQNAFRDAKITHIRDEYDRSQVSESSPKFSKNSGGKQAGDVS